MTLNIKKNFGNSRSRKPDMTTLIFGNVPPQAPEMEEAVLAACLIERGTYNSVLGLITSPEIFYVDAHQKIWQAMSECINTGMPVDLLTVTEQLRKVNELELIGGAAYLTTLTRSVISSAHAMAHAAIIYEKFIQRELIRISGSIIGAAYEDQTDAFELLERAETELTSITKNISGAGDAPVGSIFQKVLEDLNIQRHNKSALTGLDTGIYELNNILCGWQKTDLIILAARPGKGKTAIALNFAESAANSAISHGVSVGFLSLEMGAKQLVRRMAATASRIPFDKVYSGNLTDDEFSRISEYMSYFHKLPVRIADKTRNWTKLKAQAKRWKEKNNIGLLIIDYLQLIRTIRNRNDNREQEVAGITADCKELAKELDIPVILLSQLNRNVESRSVPEPTPADLRESGAIEQDADIIIFPWHKDNESFLSVAKNRNGQTATGTNAIKVKFSGKYQKWVDYSSNIFDESIAVDNPRSGIRNNYQSVSLPYKDDDGPF